MTKFDPSRSYAEIHGQSLPWKYEQDGRKFRHDGTEYLDSQSETGELEGSADSPSSDEPEVGGAGAAETPAPILAESTVGGGGNSTPPPAAEAKAEDMDLDDDLTLEGEDDPKPPPKKRGRSRKAG